MVIVLFKRFKRFKKVIHNDFWKSAWIKIGLVLTALFSLSMFALPYFEGSGPFESVLNRIWWFIVTVSTVGYGDMSPGTLPGKILGMVIIICGIGTMAWVLSNIVDLVVMKARKKMKGLIPLNEKNALVLFGYRKGKTERLVEEILADENRHDRAIILCSSSVEENPLPEQVQFVKGDLQSDDVMTRACVSHADRVIIHGHTDEQTVLITFAVNHADEKSDMNIVVSIDDEEYGKHFKRINQERVKAGKKEISVIKNMEEQMIVQEMQDKGVVVSFLQELLSNKTGSELYRVDIPSDIDPDIDLSWTFKQVSSFFKEKYSANVVGLATNGDLSSMVVNPVDTFQIIPDMCLIYIADDRLANIDWKEMFDWKGV